MDLPNWSWLIDFISPYQAHMYGIRKHLFSGRTQFQRAEVIDTYAFGRCLVLDGKIQSSELDEKIYHEMLIHPAMILHRSPKDILVIGGGEGAVLRELFKYPSVERVVMVDIDREVVELCQEHLPGWHQGEFANSKLELIFDDARRYMAETDRKFDLIISDLTEPVDDGPSYMLFTREFYRILKTKLNKGGLLAMQAGPLNINQLECHAALRNTLREYFKIIRSYHIFIPSFDTDWSFIVASQEEDPLQMSAAEVDRRLEKHSLELEVYDGETHRCVFAIPKHIRTAMAQEKRIIEDGNPLFVN